MITRKENFTQGEKHKERAGKLTGKSLLKKEKEKGEKSKLNDWTKKELYQEIIHLGLNASMKTRKSELIALIENHNAKKKKNKSESKKLKERKNKKGSLLKDV